MNLQNLKNTKNRLTVIISSEAKIVDEINDLLMWGAMKHIRNENFIWIEVPNMTKITGACENVDTLYKVDHFGMEAYLAQTGQLYLECKIPLHNKVWTIITSSRAEDSADSRHLNQFKLIEFEHHGNLEELLRNVESTIKAMFVSVMVYGRKQLDELGRLEEINRWFTDGFSRITYTKAISFLQKSGLKIEWGEDFGSKEELLLVKEFGDKPLFITHFPKKIKFFNMRVNDDTPEIVNSADLIMPYAGEAVGSAERENNYDRLVERLEQSDMFKILYERGKTLNDFQDYLDLIKKYPILHSGCGIGFSRISQAVLGVNDIRISSNYPLQNNTLY